MNIKEIEEQQKKDKIAEALKKETKPTTVEPIAVVSKENNNDDWTPLDDNVIDKPYTKDMISKSMGEAPEGYIETPIPEPQYDSPIMETETPSSSSTSSSQKSSEPKSFSSSQPSSQNKESYSANPPLEDLSASQKRKAASKTADAILISYQKFFPVPFKYIASFNMNKMEKLDMKGEIRFNMAIQEDGTTVRSYMLDINRQVERAIVVTDAMVEELKEPLVDVLMEQDLSLTPKQRLMFAFGGQFVQLLIPTIQIAIQNKGAVQSFKEFKASDDAKGIKHSAPSAPQQSTPYTQQQTRQDAQQTTTTQEQYQAPIDKSEEYVEDTEENYDAPPQQEVDVKSVGIDEYMSGETKEKTK